MKTTFGVCVAAILLFTIAEGSFHNRKPEPCYVSDDCPYYHLRFDGNYWCCRIGNPYVFLTNRAAHRPFHDDDFACKCDI
ncbi:hypothetical protein ElyMa_004406100 [Elysia marginata]|uniref:Uncharacterized protein n=1 Tax=Elysia marginata TaxID=1093978 RepID=A0AAV4H8J4_9GAST|nr:hypothetical protein ElyMa_004406100 [Elysia marginata]